VDETLHGYLTRIGNTEDAYNCTLLPPAEEAELQASQKTHTTTNEGRHTNFIRPVKTKTKAPEVRVSFPGTANPARTGVTYASRAKKSLEPASQKPASQKPASLEPASRAKKSLEPASLEPASQKPASLEPASLEPASLEPASLEPASQKPASLEPASLEKIQKGAERDAETQSKPTYKVVFLVTDETREPLVKALEKASISDYTLTEKAVGRVVKVTEANGGLKKVVILARALLKEQESLTVKWEK
jgi:hypothetical protein